MIRNIKTQFYKCFFGTVLILIFLFCICCFVGCDTTSNFDENRLKPFSFTVKYIATEGGKIRVGEDLNPFKVRYQLVDYGKDTEKIIAVPDKGYYFVKWSDGITDFMRQDKKVNKDFEITAEFAPITDPVNVVYLTNGLGVIRGESEQTIQRGTEAQPVEAELYGNSSGGEIFVRWSDGLNDSIRQDIKVTDDIEVVAEFGFKAKYTVDGEGTIIGNTDQIVVYGEMTETVTAIPNTGYRFVAWSDGVKTAKRTDRATIDIEVYAIFEWRDTDIFTYNYNYATDNCSEDGITLIRGHVDSVSAIVPQRGQYFTFDGWYLDESFTHKAFDVNGNNLLGEEIFNSPSRDLYAKWNVREEYVTTYKVLMVYVTQIDATFVGNDGKSEELHYVMPKDLISQCIELTKHFRDTLNDMLDGLVNFEIDSYFTTKSVDEYCFTNEKYSTYIYANQIPELNSNGILDEYRSILTMFSFGNKKNLETSWAGIGGEKYAAIPLDVHIDVYGNLLKAFEDYGSIIGTCVHEFIHTIEYSITSYNYHHAYNPAVPTWILDKLFLLNQFPTDFYSKLCDYPELWRKDCFLEAWFNSDKAGVPYGYWIDEIFNVTIKPECINGQTDGYGGDGMVDAGGYINLWNSNSEERDWWYDHCDIAYVQQIPKYSRTTVLFAEPKTGYRFIGWSDGVQDELRILTDVQDNITLIAYFERLSYTVEYIAGDGGKIVGESVQVVLTGDRTMWVTAVPDEGYRFVGWSDNDQGYFGRTTDERSDVIGRYVYDDNGERYCRLGFTVIAIFEKIEE